MWDLKPQYSWKKTQGKSFWILALAVISWIGHHMHGQQKETWTSVIKLFSLIKNIFFWVRVHKQGRGRERERERERESQADSTLSVQSPVWGLNPRNCEVMTWAKTKSRRLNRLSHPGASQSLFIRFYFWANNMYTSEIKASDFYWELSIPTLTKWLRIKAS